jgi:hypothetical protein
VQLQPICNATSSTDDIYYNKGPETGEGMEIRVRIHGPTHRANINYRLWTICNLLSSLTISFFSGVHFGVKPTPQHGISNIHVIAAQPILWRVANLPAPNLLVPWQRACAAAPYQTKGMHLDAQWVDIEVNTCTHTPPSFTVPDASASHSSYPACALVWAMLQVTIVPANTMSHQYHGRLS